MELMSEEQPTSTHLTSRTVQGEQLAEHKAQDCSGHAKGLPEKEQVVLPAKCSHSSEGIVPLSELE